MNFEFVSEQTRTNESANHTQARAEVSYWKRIAHEEHEKRSYWKRIAHEEHEKRSYWKRIAHEEHYLRMAEKQELESAKKAEAQREANRQRDLRRMAEKQELESSKKAEAQREANRQRRKPNFPASQNKLYSRFIRRGIKGDSVRVRQGGGSVQGWHRRGAARPPRLPTILEEQEETRPYSMPVRSSDSLTGHHVRRRVSRKLAGWRKLDDQVHDR